MQMYIGIDLGGMSIKAGLVDESYKIVATKTAPTGAERHGDEIAKSMAQLARELAEENGYKLQEIQAVGVGCPGACNSKTGICAFSANINFRDTHICEIITKELGVPAYLGNDANVAAFGEYKVINAPMESLVFVTLGTGVGGGIILDGKIYEGFNGVAAEIGHIQVNKNSENKCGCGRYGCWETEASVSALIRETQKAIQANPDCAMAKAVEGDLSRVNGRTSFDAAKAGDAVAQQVVDAFIKAVGEGVCSMINIFQPEVLLIGGAISKEGDYLLEPIRKLAETQTYKHNGVHTRIAAAQLGNDAGIIGAALLGE